MQVLQLTECTYILRNQSKQVVCTAPKVKHVKMIKLITISNSLIFLNKQGVPNQLARFYSVKMSKCRNFALTDLPYSTTNNSVKLCLTLKDAS